MSCGICYNEIKKKYVYCDICKDIYYCKSCYNNLKKYNYFVCPYCKCYSNVHIYLYLIKILKPIKKQYNKCLFKFLKDKQKYGSRNRLLFFNKEVYKNEIILVYKDLYGLDKNILNLMKLILKKDESNYTEEIIKACNYLIESKISVHWKRRT